MKYELGKWIARHIYLVFYACKSKKYRVLEEHGKNIFRSKVVLADQNKLVWKEDFYLWHGKLMVDFTLVKKGVHP